MANTPRYTFVDQAPILPILQGASNALSGVVQEVSASKAAQQRYRALANTLANQGLLGDAAIYNQMAESETPDLVAAAATGKPRIRDFAAPFDHALKSMNEQADRQNRLDVVNAQDHSAVNSRAELGATNRVLSVEASDTQNEIMMLEREKLQEQERADKAAQELGPDAAKVHTDNVDSLNKQIQEKKARVSELRNIQKTNIQTILKPTADSGAVSGGVDPGELPTGEGGISAGAYSMLDPNAPPFPPDAPTPPKEDIQKPNPIQAQPIIDIKKRDDAIRNNVLGRALPPIIDSSFFTTPLTPKNTQESVTEKQAAPTSYVEAAQDQINTTENAAIRRGILNLATAKDEAILALGDTKSKEIDRAKEMIGRAKTIPAVQAIQTQFLKAAGKELKGGYPTPTEAATDGERIRAAMGPDGAAVISIVQQDSKSGLYISKQVPKKGISANGNGTYTGPNGELFFEKGGFMFMRVGDKDTLMPDPNNPNKGITKAQFESDIARVVNSDYNQQAPQPVNPTDKQRFNGVVNPNSAPKSSVLQDFLKQ